MSGHLKNMLHTVHIHVDKSTYTCNISKIAILIILMEDEWAKLTRKCSLCLFWKGFHCYILPERAFKVRLVVYHQNGPVNLLWLYFIHMLQSAWGQKMQRGLSCRMAVVSVVEQCILQILLLPLRRSTMYHKASFQPFHYARKTNSCLILVCPVKTYMLPLYMSWASSHLLGFLEFLFPPQCENVAFRIKRQFVFLSSSSAESVRAAQRLECHLNVKP